MKGFLWTMAVIFAILAIICYSNSIISTGYGQNVANVQMTVFAAACAVLCGINLVGALLLSAILSIPANPGFQNEKKPENEKEPSKPEYPNVESTTYTSLENHEIKCDNCGEIQPEYRLSKDCGRCWKCGAVFISK